MNIAEFGLRLKSVLVEELISRAGEFANYEMKSLDLGIHPWHGYIEPSFLTTDDRAAPTRIGDWMLYSFADTSNAKWPSAQGLADWMRAYYDANPREHAPQIFAAAAEVLRSPAVRRALESYRLSLDFYVSVYDPDDSAFFNYCVQPSARAGN